MDKWRDTTSMQMCTDLWPLGTDDVVDIREGCLNTFYLRLTNIFRTFFVLYEIDYKIKIISVLRFNTCR